MSIIRAIKHRLGLSVTPANNFTFDASADNGTMKLARDTGQDIMTVDAAGKVAFPQMLQSFVAYTDATRVAGTTYTNTTGLPIIVMASFSSSVVNASLTCTVAGITIRGSEASIVGVPAAVTLVVPAGATYSITVNNGTPTLLTWVELR